VVTSNRNPSTFGQSVTLTARVTPGAATGTVQFTVDGVAFNGPVALDATGRARLITSALTVGTHSVTASYSGSVNYNPSTSPALNQLVNRSASRTVVTTSGTPVARNTVVTFTATVSAVAPGTGTPTGTVQFSIDGVAVGAPAALSGGLATYSTSTLTVGRHRVSAAYVGDAGFNASTSGAITQRVV
jgi:hypothetical protein